MTPHVHRRNAARRDLIATYQHYAREGGFRLADRFLNIAETTFRRLSSAPGIGMRYGFDHPDLSEIRVSSLSPHFNSYLVFYRPTVDGIEILRVLHAARDLHRILSEEFDIQGDSTNTEV